MCLLGSKPSSAFYPVWNKVFSPFMAPVRVLQRTRTNRLQVDIEIEIEIEIDRDRDMDIKRRFIIGIGLCDYGG